MHESTRPIKILIAKLGLDGHDRGAKVLTMGLKDEGMEVIYMGIRQTPENVVEVAVQENVDVVGLSSLTGTHNEEFPKVVELLRKRGVEKALVIGGGVIPEKDISLLKDKGIKGIFGPGSSVKDIASFIRANIR